MSTRDFLTNRTRTKAIIGSGDGANNVPTPKLVIYGDTSADGFTGDLQTDFENVLHNSSNVGNDVFLYVSGSISGKENNTANSVSVFGGDLVVSGTLYAENEIVGVSKSSMWEIVSGDLVQTGIIDGNTGLFAADFSTTATISNNEISLFSYTFTSRSDAKDLYFEFDNDGNIMPKE